MANSLIKGKYFEPIIQKIEITNDCLTGRAGLSLFVRYFRGIGLSSSLERLFGSMRRSGKGTPVMALFKQLFCFFLDGTSLHLVHFDALKQDPGYAASIETDSASMASSHTIKRFFGGFSWPRIWLFRRVLQQLFLWRLQIERPKLIMLGIDTMPMDNTDAKKRHGVEPTYKRGVAGFAPLQLTWGPYVIDAVFRGGSKHSNHGDTVAQMIRHVVARIRRHYSDTVPILLRLDSGFYDQKLYELFEEEIKIGYIGCGKLYGDIKHYISGNNRSRWGRYQNDNHLWEWIEFGDCRGTWKRFRRAIFTCTVCEDRQLMLEFARPDRILYTNLGQGFQIDHQLREAGSEEWLEAETIIEAYHGRGKDELVHRALKDYGTQTLPFKRFNANAAYYYIMLLAFFLYESFKRDVCQQAVPIACYATTFRRMVIDNAGKIVRKSRIITLKVTAATWSRLDIAYLWHSSGSPPRFAWAS